MIVQLHEPRVFDKDQKQWVPVTEDLPRFVIYKQAQNYKQGNIMKSLVLVTPGKMNNQQGQAYTNSGIPKAEAQALFDKKLKGKTK